MGWDRIENSVILVLHLIQKLTIFYNLLILTAQQTPVNSIVYYNYRMTSLSSQMEKQCDILRLIMQKMEISTEADDQDEGMAPPIDTCENHRSVHNKSRLCLS